MKMKMNRFSAITRSITLASVAMAAFTFVHAASAQYKAVGDDGIAASPKVRQILHERKASATPVLPAGSAMACPKCADLRTTELDRQAKGAEILGGAATKVVVTHACASCETKLVVAGEGKAKHTVASHKCTAEVPNPATCCASN